MLGVHVGGQGVRVHSRAGDLRADALVNCAGLPSDRIARLAGLVPQARIIPFRGEYFELGPQAAGRIRGLIYPVPDPALPWLGVHLTVASTGGCTPDRMRCWRWGGTGTGGVMSVPGTLVRCSATGDSGGWLDGTPAPVRLS